MFSLSIKALIQAILLGQGKPTELVSGYVDEIETALKSVYEDEPEVEPKGIRDNILAFCAALGEELDLFYGDYVTEVDGSCLDQDATVFSAYVANAAGTVEITINIDNTRVIHGKDKKPSVKITKRINHF
jgi:hypothetical protein